MHATSRDSAMPAHPLQQLLRPIYIKAECTPCSRSSWPCWLHAHRPSAAWRWPSGQPAMRRSHAPAANISCPVSSICAVSSASSGLTQTATSADACNTTDARLADGPPQHLVQLVLHPFVQQRLAVQHRQESVPCLVSIICKRAAGLRKSL
jgi:hypothetical protein